MQYTAGGGIYLSLAVGGVVPASCRIASSVFAYNQASGAASSEADGGGIYVGTSNQLHVMDSDLHHNSVHGRAAQGGAISSLGLVQIQRALIRDNTVTSTTGEARGAGLSSVAPRPS